MSHARCCTGRGPDCEDVEEGEPDDENERTIRQYDGPYTGKKRARYAHTFMKGNVSRLSGAHYRCGLEFACVIFDPLTHNVSSFVTDGLSGAWGDNDPECWAPVLYAYNQYISNLQDFSSMQKSYLWEPLPFQAIPGGRDIQEGLTVELMEMAIPVPRVGGRQFWTETTAEEFRSKRYICV